MDDSKAEIQSLRDRAENIAHDRTAPQPATAQSYDDMLRTLHELQVHQIELEMQNEQLRTTQLALDSERSRYFDLYDLAPVGYCTANPAGLILQANLKAATMLGMLRAGLVRQPLSRFVARSSQDAYYFCSQLARESLRSQECELQLAGPGAEPQWISLVVSPAKNEAGEDELRMTLTDQTDRHHLMVAAQAKNLELGEARAQADKANNAKSEFLSRMTHELRTPLHAILGFAQLIESSSQPMPGTHERNLAQILKAGWYLLSLINEVLEVAEIDSGQLALSAESICLDEILKDVEGMIAPLANARQVTMTFPSDIPPHWATADRQRVKQVLINLLGNAIKYNRIGGSVSVILEERRAGLLYVGVGDTGTGLTPERLAQLFQPFNRLGWQNAAERGSGIGLVVSKRLVEMMGGTIGATSTLGEGSVFWFELAIPYSVAR